MESRFKALVEAGIALCSALSGPDERDQALPGLTGECAPEAQTDSAAAVIENDGQGFDVDETRDGGLGLIGMRERIELIDGRLAVESSSTGGTSVVADVPVTG